MTSLPQKQTHFFSGLFDTVLTGYVSASMFIYGALKFMQFSGSDYSERTISELTGMELMWSFYGYSLTYPLIVGGFEILGGVLFFFRKTRIVGGLLLTSILINIIIQDIVYGVLAGAIVSASVYQLIVFFYLFKARKEIRESLRLLSKVKGPKKALLQIIVHTAIAMLVTFFIKSFLGI